jgi:hypothetical protein
MLSSGQILMLHRNSSGHGLRSVRKLLADMLGTSGAAKASEGEDWEKS